MHVPTLSLPARSTNWSLVLTLICVDWLGAEDELPLDRGGEGDRERVGTGDLGRDKEELSYRGVWVNYMDSEKPKAMFGDKFWWATGQSNLTDRMEDCSTDQFLNHVQ